MKKLMIAVAMAIALPAAAFGQAAPAPSPAAPAAHAGQDMKAMNCADMHSNMSPGHSRHQTSGAGGQADHSKMDHSKMGHSEMAAACGDMAKAGAAQAPADPQAGHKQ